MPIWSKNEENTFHKVACLMQRIPHITGLSSSDDCYRASLCFKLINIFDIGRYIEREHAQTVTYYLFALLYVRFPPEYSGSLLITDVLLGLTGDSKQVVGVDVRLCVYISSDGSCPSTILTQI